MLDRLIHSDQTPAQFDGQASHFETSVFRGAPDVHGALMSLGADVRPMTPFQTPNWLEKTYQYLAPANAGEPTLVVVRRACDGRVVLVVPLVVVRERGLRAAGFPDFGLSDYGAPLLAAMGAGAVNAAEVKALWKSICNALTGIDLLSLTNMPLAVSAKTNSLAVLHAARPSLHARYVVELDDTVEAFLVSRGKKYRKEVERCYRLLADRGAWHFERADTPSDIAAAFNALESLQTERWQGQGGDYRLEDNVVSKFYSETLQAGDDKQGAQIFTLRSGDETIAALYGLVFDNTFTLLRIASAAGGWRRLSPGRLVVIETLRHFNARHVTCFDLGIGDYAFKRGLGAKALPLVDVEHAMTWKAKPHVMLMQAKGWLYRHPQLLKAAKAARQKMSR